jgi:hypothetical protein
MKKMIIWMQLVLLSSLIVSIANVSAEQPLPLRIVVNGEKISLPDAQPFIDQQNRTQVPVRFVAEGLGAKVKWDADLAQATLELGGHEVILTIGEKEYIVDGETKEMDTEAMLVEGRTFVPARYVAESLGAKVTWYESTFTVYIDSDMERGKDYGKERNVNGFIVPADTTLTVTDERESLNFEAQLIVDWLKPDVEKQKDDMESILLQKFSADTVKQVMDHIRTKKTKTDALEGLYVYDKGTDQYVSVGWTRGDLAGVWVYKKGINPLH